MFVELMPLLKQQSLMVMVSRVDENVLHVKVIPKFTDKPGIPISGLTNAPLSLTGKPEELDRAIGRHLTAFAGAINEAGRDFVETQWKRSADSSGWTVKQQDEPGNGEKCECGVDSSSLVPRFDHGVRPAGAEAVQAIKSTNSSVESPGVARLDFMSNDHSADLVTAGVRESWPSCAYMVSVVVPCRNEVKAIHSFLNSVLKQDLKGLHCEVIIADGMSDDGTREILKQFEVEHPQIRMIDNPSRIVSTGLNTAICAARGDIIVRMDVHTEYKADYIRCCVAALDHTGADNVGGACIAKGQGYVGKAIAAAFQSAFAVGGARWHQPSYKGPVDTVHLGCWRRDVFQRIGFFDESLVRNQDDELNLRLIRSGGTVWQSPEIVSWYHPRSSLATLFRQYFQYGFWKVAVIRKHALPASWRHLVPGAFVLANFVFFTELIFREIAGLTPFSWSTNLGVGMDFVYVSASLFFAFIAAKANDWILLPLLPLVFATYHLAYGLGFLGGVFHFSTKSRRLPGCETVFTKLSR